MGLLRHSLKDLVKVQLDDEALDKLQWKDFGNGLSMARLARAGARELVLYRIEENADPNAFSKHEHIGGEFYEGETVVLEIGRASCRERV